MLFTSWHYQTSVTTPYQYDTYVQLLIFRGMLFTGHNEL